jgi:hypothetical protein
MSLLIILHLGEPLAPQQLLRDVVRRQTNAWDADQTDPGYLGGRLCRDWPGMQAEEPRRPRQGQPAQEASPRPVFSLLETHRDLLSRSDRAQRDVSASVEGLERGVNHHARCRTPAVLTRSASFRTGVKEVVAQFVRVSP